MSMLNKKIVIILYFVSYMIIDFIATVASIGLILSVILLSEDIHYLSFDVSSQMYPLPIFVAQITLNILIAVYFIHTSTEEIVDTDKMQTKAIAMVGLFLEIVVYLIIGYYYISYLTEYGLQNFAVYIGAMVPPYTPILFIVFLHRLGFVMILYFVFDKIEIEETIGLGLIFFCYNVILFMYSTISFLSSILNIIPVCRLYQIFEEKKMKNLGLLARIQIAFLFIFMFFPLFRILGEIIIHEIILEFLFYNLVPKILSFTGTTLVAIGYIKHIYRIPTEKN